jgi:hypothetical protein
MIQRLLTFCYFYLNSNNNFLFVMDKDLFYNDNHLTIVRKGDTPKITI